MFREASGLNLEPLNEVLRSLDLRSAFERTIPVAYDGGNGEDNDEEEDDGTEDETTDPGGDSGGDNVKDPDKKKLHDEAAKYRNQAKKVQKQLDDLKAEREKELREADDAKKSDLEKAQRDLNEANERISKLEATSAIQSAELQFFKSGAAAQFQDPADALKFLDLKSLEKDDDGVITPKAMKEAADELLKSKSYLGRKPGDGEEGSEEEPPTMPSGRETNGTKKKSADRATLEKKFPALQGRG